jgi:hypothetical protein
MPKIGICSKCGDPFGMVFKNRETEKLVCRKCLDFFKYLNKVGWENCGICGKFGRPALRAPEGYGICQCCYRSNFAPRKLCEGCSEVKPMLSRYQGELLCSTCRSKRRNSNPKYFQKCSGCHKDKPVATRNIEGIAICHNCYFKGVR